MVKQQQNRILEKIDTGDMDIEIKNTFSVINGFSVRVTKKGLEKLEDEPLVERIYYDGIKYLTLDKSVPQINADDVWSLRPFGTNLTGAGQTVCVIDSGVDYTHPNLGNCSQAQFLNGACGRVIGGHDYQNNDTDPMDDEGHGTHVAGIIISNHTTYTGVAPGAKIVAIKACDDGFPAACDDSKIIAGIDWCIANRTKLNISIITMSLGGGQFSEPCDDIGDAVVTAGNNATGFGIFVDASSGNDGWSTDIASPACGSNITAVGGIGDDDISIEYNRAPIMNILAPSQTIMSTVLRSGGAISDASGFKSLDGTSMAAPHVAGVAALLLQFNSSLSAADITRFMNDTGKEINDGGTIYKRVDALAAIRAIDRYAPFWYGNSSNNTAPAKNDILQFNISWNDTIGLSSWIFSWNDTGHWINLTNGTLIGRSSAVSLNLSIIANQSRVVSWKFYCNDTNNNWNVTDEWFFTVSNSRPNSPV
jgi:minor extracellular serine protease Vpr